MAGLPTNSSENTLQQWYQLFESRGENRSIQARQHWQQLLRTGLPTRKQENWKYTPLETLFSQRFVLAEKGIINAQQVSQLALNLDAVRLVYINGQFSAELSDHNFDLFDVQIMRGATPRNLAEPIQSDVFLHLTESLAEEVTQIHLARGKRALRPLYLLHISSGSDNQQHMSASYYRHHVQLDVGAQAQLIEHYVSLNSAAHFTGTRVTMALEDNTQLNHTKLTFENAGSYHFAHNDVTVSRDCRVNSQSFLLGSGLTRHNTCAQLNGENSDLVINSLILPIGRDIVDTRTYLEHNKGHCQSRQLHKTIVRDRARAVFNGVIKVAPYALKTDGQMTNNNLLLGRQAEVDTKPQLEIYADDVKCSHGATVGRIDDEQLFYLRSRGIDETSAHRMIIYAFAAELTDAITDETLKEAVLQCIARRFPETDNVL